ncbi:succinate dehydrogenase cytochrome b subunit [Nocardioidaceae bacterium]|nr:succinate dehydrogenase cytochrome b subunit [Nocardioidaceae bacterium]
MAVTGAIFIAYVAAHMFGNLKVFQGQEKFDSYAEFLRTFGEPLLPYAGFLWIVRVVLIAAIIGHVYAAYTLWARASGARNVKYSMKKATTSTLSSRTMRWGGTALLLYIVFHILHLTTKTVGPGPEESIYQRLVAGFQPEYWYIAVIYLAAQVALGMHLRHGTYSALQTMGLTTTPAAQARASAAGLVLAVVIAGGFAIIPLSVLVGIVE